MSSQEETERRFIESAKAHLDRTVDGLDGRTLARLREARRRALEASPRRVPWLMWAGGFATACVALLVASLWLFSPTTPGPTPGLEDVEILASSEDLGFYDDLDFYHWLADEELAG